MAQKYPFIILVILEYPLVLIAHKIDPTNLAGLGLDIPLMFLFIAFNILMIVSGIIIWKKGLLPKLTILVSVISFLLFWHWWNQPS
jgi:hypothetical protein